MRAARLAVAIITLCGFCGQTALAQAPKFKRCLSPAEIQGERLVQHGVFLREGTTRCNDTFAGLVDQWKTFDETFGPRLKAQTDKRKRMFDKEFRQDSDKVRTYFDGRLVTYYRNYPLTEAYCEGIKDLMGKLQKGGWGQFSKQAQTVQNQVLMDYKPCR